MALKTLTWHLSLHIISTSITPLWVLKIDQFASWNLDALMFS